MLCGWSGFLKKYLEILLNLFYLFKPLGFKWEVHWDNCAISFRGWKLIKFRSKVNKDLIYVPNFCAKETTGSKLRLFSSLSPPLTSSLHEVVQYNTLNKSFSTHPIKHCMHIPLSSSLLIFFILIPSSLPALGSLQGPAPFGSCDRGPWQDVHSAENIRAGLRGRHAASHWWSVGSSLFQTKVIENFQKVMLA